MFWWVTLIFVYLNTLLLKYYVILVFELFSILVLKVKLIILSNGGDYE